MGKRNKKSFYKKELKPIIKGNKVLFAALGGVATGIALANIFGTEKAREILQSVEDSISSTVDRITNGFNTKNGNASEMKHEESSLHHS